MMRLGGKLGIPLLGKARRFAAVDFDSRQLRVVLAEQAGGLVRVGKLASLPLPEGLDVAHAEAFGFFLGRTLKDIGFRGAGVVMNVPRSQAVLKPLKLPPGTAGEELAGMVHYQVGKELAFPAQDAVIDFTHQSHYDAGREDWPGGEADQSGETEEVDVLAAAIRLSVVDYYRRVAEAAGVKLLRLGLRPYANMRCLEACGELAAGRSLAAIHITADETEIDVLADRTLAFSRSAVESVAAAADAGRSAVAETVGSLVTEVARSLQSYEALKRGEQIDAAIVAGGTGLESEVARQLTQRLGVPCGTLQPQRAFESRPEAPIRLPAAGERASSAFISALGLAVVHPATGRLPFDFLNPRRPSVRRDARKIRVAAAAVAAAVILLAAVTSGWVYLDAKEDRVKSLQAAAAKLSREIKVLQKRADRLGAIEAWAAGGQKWLDHLAYLSCVFPPARDVYLTGLRTHGENSVSFRVQGLNSEAITALSRRLDRAGYLVKPGPIKTVSDSHGYVYNTTLRVSVSPDVKIDLATTRPAERPSDEEKEG